MDTPAGDPETTLLILQSTPYCNIDCRYCYLPDRDARDRMSMDTLRAAIRAVENAGLNRGQLTACWHAGEPLALPVEYYRDAFAVVRQEQRAAPIGISIQTNGIAITDAYCQLFCDYDVNVGVSLDGPEELHDSRRVTRTGAGTHALTVRGLQRLQAYGRQPHVLAVVTADTVARPAHEFYRFFRELGVTKICLNFEEIEGINRRSSMSSAERALRAWIADLYDLALADPTCWIRELAEAMTAAQSGRPGRNSLTRPFAIVSVDWRGRFSTFSPELLTVKDPTWGDFLFGDVHDGPVTATLRSPKLQAVKAAIEAGNQTCRETCPYFDGCLGGTPSNKLAEHGTFEATETLSCRTRVKILHDVLFAKWEDELAAGTFSTLHGGRGI